MLNTNAPRSGVAVIAAAAVFGLTAGMISSPAVAAPQPRQTGRQSLPAGDAAAAAEHWVTLVTGDRVAVDAKGQPVVLDRAPGRERIPVEVRRTGDHTLVVPADADRLITQGVLDQRLFDVTELGGSAYRSAAGLKLVVGYDGAAKTSGSSAAGARSALRSADGAKVTRTFPRLNAEAVTAPKEGAADVWHALTAPDARAAAPGVRKVWLDAPVKAALDVSVPQIGAPDAWKAGFDGTGVKVAVLDTGVDETHPDLAGQQLAEKNFTTDPTAVDGHGHGTHVASTVAGTGAKSGGKYKGVAPGARILDGKVLSASGSGDTSWILAGMEWAVAQGADIVSMSLGATDTPGTDPLEEAVDRLSADGGPLFVVAAGNAGPSANGTIGSPGSADAALTVGAVDKQDGIASFSSTGPRLGDGGIKPDVTAPGVDIAAAQAAGTHMGTPVTDGYVSASGTSMATPHVSGAAALLKQQHPDWSGQRLKQLLSSATKPGEYTSYQQGSGRIDLTQAIVQTVVSETGSLNFGKQAWPHEDDAPVTKSVTYRNNGTEPVTFDLSLTATAPGGQAAPEGMFAVSPKQLTVPAGGTAEAAVTADTRTGGTVNGAYSARITATGGGQIVRTAAVVNRGDEAYKVTFEYIGRDGKPAQHFNGSLTGTSDTVVGNTFSLAEGSSTTVEVRKGTYFGTHALYPTGTGEDFTGMDWMVQPALTVDHDMTVTIDARTAKPVDITVPDRGAEPLLARTGVELEWLLPIARFALTNSYRDIRTAQVGPDPKEELLHEFMGTWKKKSDGTEYNVAYGGKGVPVGFERHLGSEDFATTDVRLGSPLPGRQGNLMLTPNTGTGVGTSFAVVNPLPAAYRMYLNTDAELTWDLSSRQIDADGQLEVQQRDTGRTFTRGRSYRLDYNIGVFGPRVNGVTAGVQRSGDAITAAFPMFADGAGHTGATVWDAEATKTALYRDGEPVGTSTAPPTGVRFTVPPGKAAYRLTTSAVPAKPAAVSTRIDAAWTFTSDTAASPTMLPVSTVRFTPQLGLDSTARAGRPQLVPVTVEGAAAGNTKSLKVSASFDGGTTWHRAVVLHGTALLLTPAAGATVSLRAEVTDRQGNTLTQTVIDAYRAK
ncbi:S8 family peptidase [Streptomyces sp. NBC_01257]|uniref:S8 family peptidase n=1 Tax=Streptomyces sp. NBC_01257 TaxID=2903799 RepID=UPI002DDB4FAB|nr:S8 family peptidase [Streptomyces sp. NBC_01257]WRZ67233.1 S8 family peptidase [Streptomyces sp. NBC_01257]